MYSWWSTKFSISPKCICDNIKSLLGKCFQGNAIRLCFLKEKDNKLLVFSIGGFNLIRCYLRDAHLFPHATKSGGNFAVRNGSSKCPVQIYLTQGPWNVLYWGKVI